MDQQKRILVTGAGGFIGHHLVRYLKKQGHWVRGVDIKAPEYSPKEEADEFFVLDLRYLDNCLKATKDIDEVYALAADMGGMGFITFHTSDILYNNVSINANTAEAAKQNKVQRLFFASSACAYPKEKQEDVNVIPLKESDAYPANPDSEYGWEKLFSERLYRSYEQFYEVRIARYHNIFGPEGTYKGERAKAPGQLCHKVAMAREGEAIEVWGDGQQTRSFCYIDDCVEGTVKLMNSDIKEVLNIGSDHLVTINQMIDIICTVGATKKVSGTKAKEILSQLDPERIFTPQEVATFLTASIKKDIKKQYDLSKPQGVRGRNSDNTLCKQLLKWEPQISLQEGLARTYQWVAQQVAQEPGVPAETPKNPLQWMIGRNKA